MRRGQAPQMLSTQQPPATLQRSPQRNHCFLLGIKSMRSANTLLNSYDFTCLMRQTGLNAYQFSCWTALQIFSYFDTPFEAFWNQKKKKKRFHACLSPRWKEGSAQVRGSRERLVGSSGFRSNKTQIKRHFNRSRPLSEQKALLDKSAGNLGWILNCAVLISISLRSPILKGVTSLRVSSY